MPIMQHPSSRFRPYYVIQILYYGLQCMNYGFILLAAVVQNLRFPHTCNASFDASFVRFDNLDDHIDCHPLRYAEGLFITPGKVR